MTNSRMQDIMIDKLGYHLSEATLYGRFIKYHRLKEILIENPILESPVEVNIFIDLTQSFLPLYKFDNIANPMGLLATMLNLPLHYRHYFNRINLKSNIFLIYSTNTTVNTYKHLPYYDYKHKMLIESNKNIHDIITHNIELLSTVIPYFPGIYLKQGTVEPTVIAYDLIDKFTRGGKLNSLNIFITSTDYAYQLPAVLNNVLLIYKKSVFEDNHNSDISLGITHNNALSIYIQNKSNQILDNINILNQNTISPFMILNGLPCRSIKALFSYQKSLSILNNIIGSYNLITPENLIEEIHKIKNNITLDEIYARYYAIDIDYQLSLYRQLGESLESDFLKDLYDNQALYNIVNTYFKETNTVDLIKL